MAAQATAVPTETLPGTDDQELQKEAREIVDRLDEISNRFFNVGEIKRLMRMPTWLGTAFRYTRDDLAFLKNLEAKVKRARESL